MIRMRWLALALLCTATTAVSAQGTKPDSGKAKKAVASTKVAVDKGANDTRNAVVKGAKDTKNSTVTAAKDTRNATVTAAKDTKNAVKKAVKNDTTKKF